MRLALESSSVLITVPSVSNVRLPIAKLTTFFVFLCKACTIQIGRDLLLIKLRISSTSSILPVEIAGVLMDFAIKIIRFKTVAVEIHRILAVLLIQTPSLISCIIEGFMFLQ